MSMVTYDFIFEYEGEPKARIEISFTWPPTKDRFTQTFFPAGFRLENGLIYSVRAVSLEDVLEFMGATFAEARENIPDLDSMMKSKEKMDSGHLQIDSWELFYERHSKGSRPINITARICEHY